MQGADRLAVLDPAAPERSIGVRATPQKSVERAGIVEDCDPQAIDINGQGLSFNHVSNPADRDKLSQRRRPCQVPAKRGGSEKPRTCVTRFGFRTVYCLSPAVPKTSLVQHEPIQERIHAIVSPVPRRPWPVAGRHVGLQS